MLKEKSETCDQAKTLFKKKQNEKWCLIKRIRSDHEREFENSAFEDYCDEVGIKQEFSTPTTPQQNGVIERKNRVIQDMACAMLHGKGLATHF